MTLTRGSVFRSERISRDIIIEKRRSRDTIIVGGAGGTDDELQLTVLTRIHILFPSPPTQDGDSFEFHCVPNVLLMCC